MVEDTPIVRGEGIRKSFGSTVALASVETEVEQGTIIGLLGHNGTGKSSLGRFGATLVTPDAGRAWVAGAEERGLR